ncbi:zinc-binding dehydrogenase [Streptomyces sp. NPDC090075]|uniref:zinc-binding dehydrogenase n=1 Tax=Streptomyces sp. NPDC090075 TaxID=3365937 RepID=UPI00380777E9
MGRDEVPRLRLVVVAVDGGGPRLCQGCSGPLMPSAKSTAVFCEAACRSRHWRRMRRVTAYQAIEAARLDTGHIVLINGASGGVGQSAIQFAVNEGARVLATAAPDVSGRLRELGAHETVDFTSAAVAEQVLAAHPEGIDAVLDLVTRPGGDIGPLADLLKPGGRLVSTNHATDPDALVAREIHGVNLSNDPSRAELTALADLAAAGKLRVTLDAEIRLDDAPAAVTRARSGHARGKTVILL